MHCTLLMCYRYQRKGNIFLHTHCSYSGISVHITANVAQLLSLNHAMIVFALLSKKEREMEVKGLPLNLNEFLTKRVIINTLCLEKQFSEKFPPSISTTHTVWIVSLRK